MADLLLPAADEMDDLDPVALLEERRDVFPFGQYLLVKLHRDPSRIDGKRFEELTDRAGADASALSIDDDLQKTSV